MVSSELVGPSQIAFPVRYRTFPLVWVARNKHANYKSKAACNAGGGKPLGASIPFDTCDMTAADTRFYRNRMPVRANRNVGRVNDPNFGPRFSGILGAPDPSASSRAIEIQRMDPDRDHQRRIVLHPAHELPDLHGPAAESAAVATTTTAATGR